jgi:hypothetical protein
MIELRQYCYVAGFAIILFLIGFPVCALIILAGGAMAFEYEDFDELE